MEGARLAQGGVNPMRANGLRTAIGAGALVLALTLTLAPAAADADVEGGYDPDGSGPQTTTEVTVTSTPEGVTIYIESEQVTPGSEGGPGSGGGSPGGDGSGSEPPSCQASPVNIGHTSTEWVAEGLAENPGTFPWGVSCDDGSFGIAWVPTDAQGSPEVVAGYAPPPPIDPEVVRDAVFEIVPLSPISVRVNPAVGLVAVESWFWVGGYGGGTLTGSATLEARTSTSRSPRCATAGAGATVARSPPPRAVSPTRREAPSATPTSAPHFRPAGATVCGSPSPGRRATQRTAAPGSRSIRSRAATRAPTPCGSCSRC